MSQHRSDGPKGMAPLDKGKYIMGENVTNTHDEGIAEDPDEIYRRESVTSDIRDIINKLDLSEITQTGDEFNDNGSAESSGVSTASSETSSPINTIHNKEKTSEAQKIQNGECHLGRKESINSGSSSIGSTSEDTSVRDEDFDTNTKTIYREYSDDAIAAEGKVEEDKKKKKKKSFGFLKRLSFSKESSSSSFSPVTSSSMSSTSPAGVAPSVVSHTNDSQSPLQEKPTPGTVIKLRVDSLPQIFAVKYLGSRPCTGLHGAEHTRVPVDGMINAVKQLKPEEDLSLLLIRVSVKGIEMKSHRENQGPKVDSQLVPIDLISYGVQDHRYSRVFTFIVVREMSWAAKKMECHAFVCDSSTTANKLSLCMALAFKLYAQSLQGKPYKFQVDLHAGQTVEETRALPTSEYEA